MASHINIIELYTQVTFSTQINGRLVVIHETQDSYTVLSKVHELDVVHTPMVTSISVLIDLE